MSKQTTALHLDQIWEERDKRSLIPRIRVIALDGSNKATCVRVIYSSAHPGIHPYYRAVGKPIRIGVKRLQHCIGWKLVQEAD